MFRALKIAGARARRFRRDRRGNAAIEFALVALPFFMLTLGLAEIGMMGVAQTSLDHAVSDVARRIRTGETQGAGLSYSQVQAELCSSLTSILPVSCAGNLYLDVNTFDSYVAVQNNSPVQNGQLQSGGFGYNPGVQSSIVVVRAYFRWHIFTPLFQGIMGDLRPDGSPSTTPKSDRLLSSSMMFRNEPFGGTPSP